MLVQLLRVQLLRLLKRLLRLPKRLLRLLAAWMLRGLRCWSMVRVQVLRLGVDTHILWRGRLRLRLVGLRMSIEALLSALWRRLTMLKGRLAVLRRCLAARQRCR